MKLCILIFLAVNAWSASLVQAISAGTSSVQFASADHAHALLVASCETSTGGDTVTGVSDTEGNTWVRARYDGQSPINLFTYYAVNATGGTRDTVTFAGSVTCDRVWLHEFSGMATSGVVDGTSGNFGVSGSCDPGGIVTTNANDLIFAVGVSNDGTAGKEATGYTAGVTALAEDSEYQIASATGTYDPFFTSTALWTCSAVAFKQMPAIGAARRRILN